MDITPAPRGATWIKDRCPHKVIIAGRTFDAPPPTIPVGQAEKFEPFVIHPNGIAATAVSYIDTENQKQITIEIGEQWHFMYQVFAENSNAISLELVMHRKDDGSVTVEGINDTH